MIKIMYHKFTIAKQRASILSKCIPKILQHLPHYCTGKNTDTPIKLKGNWYPRLAVSPPSLPEYNSGNNIVRPRSKIKAKIERKCKKE